MWKREEVQEVLHGIGEYNEILKWDRFLVKTMQSIEPNTGISAIPIQEINEHFEEMNPAIFHPFRQNIRNFM